MVTLVARARCLACQRFWQNAAAGSEQHCRCTAMSASSSCHLNSCLPLLCPCYAQPPEVDEKLEQGCVSYQTNVLGTRGPRKMTAIIPSLKEDSKPAFVPAHSGETLMDRCGKPCWCSPVHHTTCWQVLPVARLPVRGAADARAAAPHHDVRTPHALQVPC